MALVIELTEADPLGSTGMVPMARCVKPQDRTPIRPLPRYRLTSQAFNPSLARLKQSTAVSTLDSHERTERVRHMFKIRPADNRRADRSGPCRCLQSDTLRAEQKLEELYSIAGIGGAIEYGQPPNRTRPGNGHGRRGVGETETRDPPRRSGQMLAG